MKEVTIDINVAKAVVEIMGGLNLDYAPSKIRNMAVDHILERVQEAEKPSEEE